MPSQGTRGVVHASAVVAAQTGDREARELLFQGHLPLVYNIVGMASDGGDHTDGVEAIVRATIARALDELPLLEHPDRFRSWLCGLAVAQVRAARRDRPPAQASRENAERGGPPIIGCEEPPNDFAAVAIRQLGLTGQRRELVEATRWMDDDDREVLALYWLESAGELTRAELETATGLSSVDAAVRVVQVEEHLEEARLVVRARSGTPLCADLPVPGSEQPTGCARVTLATHARDCAACREHEADLVPAERLLRGSTVVPVPDSLAGPVPDPRLPSRRSLIKREVVGARAATAPKGGWRRRHRDPEQRSAIRSWTGPFVATAVIGILGVVAGITVYSVAAADTGEPRTTGVVANATVRPSRPAPSPSSSSLGPLESRPPPPSGGSASPTPRSSSTAPAPGTDLIRASRAILGRHSLRLSATTNGFLRTEDHKAIVEGIDSGRSDKTKRLATFDVVTGLAHPDCYSFLDTDGRYLRHDGTRLVFDFHDGSNGFPGDATFCARAGGLTGTIVLLSFDHPDLYVHARLDNNNDNVDVFIDRFDSSSGYRAGSTFTVTDPWA